MGFPKEPRATINGSDKEMSLLMVFYPDQSSRNTSIAVESSSLLPLSFSMIRRSSSSGYIITKAQSTISICAFLVFLTLFLFTLSTFEPSVAFPALNSPTHRRFLLKCHVGETVRDSNVSQFALQGMGTLFLRGTKAMHEAVVTHVPSETRESELRLFLRLLHRSGVTSRCDIIFIFTSPTSVSRFSGVIREENNSFLRLVDVHRNLNSTNRIDSVWGFDVSRFVNNHGNKMTAEPIWGRKHGSHRAGNESVLKDPNNSVLSHGSLVGFDVGELDPENSLSGFVDNVPMSLRRWACYRILLGRVRHNFKHVMLVDAKSSLFFGDPLTRIRNRSSDSVFVFFKQSKRNLARTRPNSFVNSEILMGGAKGVRRLTDAMMTEIVKTTMQHRKKNVVSDTAILSQLVGNVHITKNFQVVTSNDPIAEASSLGELRTKKIEASSSLKNHDVIMNGNGNHYNTSVIIMKHICSSEIDSSVYMYC